MSDTGLAVAEPGNHDSSIATGRLQNAELTFGTDGASHMDGMSAGLLAAHGNTASDTGNTVYQLPNPVHLTVFAHVAKDAHQMDALAIIGITKLQFGPHFDYIDYIGGNVRFLEVVDFLSPYEPYGVTLHRVEYHNNRSDWAGYISYIEGSPIAHASFMADYL